METNVMYAEEERVIPEGTGVLVWTVVATSLYAAIALGFALGVAFVRGVHVSLIGSDFVWVQVARPCKCSECGKHIAPGVKALESVRFGKVQKRVCSEECRLDFDDAFWQEKARQRRLA